MTTSRATWAGRATEHAETPVYEGTLVCLVAVAAIGALTGSASAKVVPGHYIVDLKDSI